MTVSQLSLRNGGCAVIVDTDCFYVTLSQLSIRSTVGAFVPTLKMSGVYPTLVTDTIGCPPLEGHGILLTKDNSAIQHRGRSIWGFLVGRYAHFSPRYLDV